ncbi:MAG: hypothetical protein WKG00_38145 [Polyangiaceae bacterium]
MLLAPAGCASSPPPAASPPAAGAAAGRGDVGKVSECRALVRLVNAGVQRADSRLARTSDPSDELRATASAVEELADEIERLPLKQPQLVRLAGDYKSMARALASGTRELAGAVGKGDPEERARAKETIQAAVAQEPPIVDQINVFCSGSPGPDPEVPAPAEPDPTDVERHET